MAEFLFKKYVADKGVSDKFYIESAATSAEELGNPVYPPVKRILDGLKIDCSNKRARKIVLQDYENFDYLIGMDDYNIRNMKNFFGGDKNGKIYKLLDFSDERKEQNVADPWYTSDFDATKREILLGIESFYQYISNKKI